MNEALHAERERLSAADDAARGAAEEAAALLAYFQSFAPYLAIGLIRAAAPADGAAEECGGCSQNSDCLMRMVERYRSSAENALAGDVWRRECEPRAAEVREIFSALLSAKRGSEAARAERAGAVGAREIRVQSARKDSSGAEAMAIAKVLRKIDVADVGEKLAFIRDNMQKGENPSNGFDSILGALQRSLRELALLETEEEQSNVLKDDYLKNPPFDLIREIPEYQKLDLGLKNLEPLVRTQLVRNDIRVREIFGTMKLFEKIIGLSLFDSNDDLQIKSLLNEDIQTRIDVMRLKVFDLISQKEEGNRIQKFKSLHFINSVFRKYEEISKTKEMSRITQIIREIHNLCQTSNNSITKENNELISYRMVLEEKLKSFHPEICMRNVNVTQEAIADLRASISSLVQQCIDKKEKANEILIDVLKTNKIVFNNDVHIGIIPLQIEELITLFYQKAPIWIWYKERLEHHRKENIKIKQNRLELKDNLNELQEKVAQKKERIKYGTKIKKNRCPICKTRDRNVIILTCGHTFCNECLSHRRSCPYCDSPFSSTEIHQINWK